jgi:hypothetical protein
VTRNEGGEVDWACSECGGERLVVRTFPERRLVDQGPPGETEDRRGPIWY